MKKFTFPLEVVLDARRAQEDEANQQLSVALENHRQAVIRSQEAVAELNRILADMSATCQGRFTAADRDRGYSMRRAQERICAELDKVTQNCGRIVLEKRSFALQRRRDRELLERLKSERLSVWQKESALAEQHQFDEFAMTRRHQAALQGQPLC